MKIAIVGAGAAGMTTAYLLNKYHSVTIFEKQSILGGNIRTLNKNVSTGNLDHHLNLENGVIEFPRDNFPNFHKLMQDLHIKMEPHKISSKLFLANGICYKSGGEITYYGNGCYERLKEIIKLIPIIKGYLPFLLKASRSQYIDLYNKPVSDYLGNEIYAIWLKMLLMYAYSMPYQRIDDFPAEMAIPLLYRSGCLSKWERIVGGVYTYIEKILEQFTGQIYYNAQIKSIIRTSSGVTISTLNGENFLFDKIVFAVTPDQVLPLLQDASADEKRRFGEWKENKIETIIHTDISFYQMKGVSHYSEFDLFQHRTVSTQLQYGYNAYLNHLCGIDHKKYYHYSLAYNLNQLINPKKIVHQQQHHTPLYSVNAVKYRHEIIATNGNNHTYHAGAYLGEGLHEGAISSAFTVANLLN